MISGLRKYAYIISALAILCFFIYPEPYIAVVGALVLQTLAYIIVAGKSAADGVILTGITVLLIGSIPADHPLIREAYFLSVKPWVIATGIAVIILGLLLLRREFTRRY
ncbi:MAG: hypothetical protein KAJ06_09335 [Gammaproteobacteria bacterium]|nr:hypothetical protein [Gammaproteobacteria bacterium]